MRFTNIILAYFVMGSVLWAGGAIGWDQAGMGGVVVDPTGNTTEINNETGEQLEQSGGPIQEAAGMVGGGALLAIWNVIVTLLGVMFWPIITLGSVGAPPRVQVVLGGALVMAFLGAAIRLIRSSA